MLISVLFTNSSEYKFVEHDLSFPTVPQTYYDGTKPGDLLELVNHTWLSILGALGTNTSRQLTVLSITVNCLQQIKYAPKQQAIAWYYSISVVRQFIVWLKQIIVSKLKKVSVLSITCRFASTLCLSQLNTTEWLLPLESFFKMKL